MSSLRLEIVADFPVTLEVEGEAFAVCMDHSSVSEFPIRLRPFTGESYLCKCGEIPQASHCAGRAGFGGLIQAECPLLCTNKAAFARAADVGSPLTSESLRRCGCTDHVRFGLAGVI